MGGLEASWDPPTYTITPGSTGWGPPGYLLGSTGWGSSWVPPGTSQVVPSWVHPSPCTQVVPPIPYYCVYTGKAEVYCYSKYAGGYLPGSTGWGCTGGTSQVVRDGGVLPGTQEVPPMAY